MIILKIKRTFKILTPNHRAWAAVFFLFVLPLYTSAQNDTTADNRIYMLVPQMPTFPGNLDNYIRDHIKQPKAAVDNTVQGTVNVTFVITRVGEIKDVSVLSGISPGVDSEAVRMVRAMPPWNPGMKNGKAVNVQYNLPVHFGSNNGKNGQFQLLQSPPKPLDTIFVLRNGLYVDPYLGFGEGGPHSSTSLPLNMSSNFKFGVGLTYMFASGIGISAGLQIQQYKFGYTYSNVVASYAYNDIITKSRPTANDTVVTAGYNATVNYSFTYAQIPLLCRYISSQENRLGFYAEAGLIINYLMSSQISGTVAQTQYDLTQMPNTFWYTYNSTNLNSTAVNATPQNPAKLTMAIHGGAGILIPFTNKLSLIVEASSDVGIANAGEGSKDVVSFGTSKFYLYGNGNYGSFNSYLLEAKFLIKMSKASKTIHIN